MEQVNPDGSLGYTFALDSSGQTGVGGITVDSSTNVYVTGATKSTTFATTANAFQTTNHGGNDAIVAKISPPAADLTVSNNAPVQCRAAPSSPTSLWLPIKDLIRQLP